jgi:hypothetical protein
MPRLSPVETSGVFDSVHAPTRKGLNTRIVNAGSQARRFFQLHAQG